MAWNRILHLVHTKEDSFLLLICVPSEAAGCTMVRVSYVYCAGILVALYHGIVMFHWVRSVTDISTRLRLRHLQSMYSSVVLRGCPHNMLPFLTLNLLASQFRTEIIRQHIIIVLCQQQKLCHPCQDVVNVTLQ